MSGEAALSTKQKNSPAPTRELFVESSPDPLAYEAKGSGFTTRKFPVILTVATGAATPGTADPQGVSSHNPKAPAFQKPEATPQSRQVPGFCSRELLAICEEADRKGWTPADYLAVARWCQKYRPQAVFLWLRLAQGARP